MWVYLLLFSIIVYLCNREAQGYPLTTRGLSYVMFGMALFVGVSDMLGGYDRYIYGELFDSLADSIRAGENGLGGYVFLLYSGEKGFGLLNLLIAYLTSNRYIFIFILTLIIYFNLYHHFKNYTLNYAFALLIFLGFWFFFSFTYLRQVLGASIAWYSIKYILERKFWKFFLVTYIAYMFHNSAIVFFPLYFVPIQKYKKDMVKKVLIIVFLIGATGLPSALFDAYDAASGNARVGEYSNNAQWAYLVEVLVLMYFIFKNYDRLFETKLMTLMTNMAIVFCAVLVLFYRSENGGRLSWYFMIGIISTLSTLSFYVKQNSQPISDYTTINIRYTSVVLLLCFALYFRIVFSWGVLLYPYKTFFTPGIRQGDFIEAFYEYDHGYDSNKFYR